jgi:membrane protein
LSIAADRRREHVGRPPASPRRLTVREWLAAIKRAFASFMADDCMGLAQQVAYASMLAFFPAMIAFIGLLGLLHLFDDVQTFLAPVVPHGVITFLGSLQRDTTSGTGAAAFAIGLAGALWAASGAMSGVIKAVNRAYDRVETRPFWKVRTIAAVLVAVTGTTVIVLFGLIIGGGYLGDAIAEKARLGSVFRVTWGVARWPLAFAGILVFFALVYYLAPNQSPRSWKWITPGSVLGGLLWLGLSGLFALYATFLGSYSETYGTLAAGVILLLWLNYTAWAILFGAELNAELDRQADIRAAGGPHAGLVKPARRAG